MKRFLGLALILSSFSLPAFAARNSQKVTFYAPTKVGSTQVPAGSYKATWTGSDSNLQLSIVRGKKTLVTVPAKLVPDKNVNLSVSTQTVNGATVLRSIQLYTADLVLKKNSQASGQ